MAEGDFPWSVPASLKPHFSEDAPAGIDNDCFVQRLISIFMTMQSSEWGAHLQAKPYRGPNPGLREAAGSILARLIFFAWLWHWMASQEFSGPLTFSLCESPPTLSRTVRQGGVCEGSVWQLCKGKTIIHKQSSSGRNRMWHPRLNRALYLLTLVDCRTSLKCWFTTETSKFCLMVTEWELNSGMRNLQQHPVGLFSSPLPAGLCTAFL